MPKNLKVIYCDRKTKRKKTYPCLSYLLMDRKIKEKPINIYKHLQRNGIFENKIFYIKKYE